MLFKCFVAFLLVFFFSIDKIVCAAYLNYVFYLEDQ